MSILSRARLVFDAVPVGESNARPARDIWRVIGCWPEVTIASQLNELAKADRIRRKEDSIPSGFRWIYWREAV